MTLRVFEYPAHSGPFVKQNSLNLKTLSLRTPSNRRELISSEAAWYSFEYQNRDETRTMINHVGGRAFQCGVILCSGVAFSHSDVT